MIRKTLLAKLRAHKGPIYLDVNNHNDGFWLQGVKSDLIEQMTLRFQADNQETGFDLDTEQTPGIAFFGKDYSA